jgi:hypothetical protein
MLCLMNQITKYNPGIEIEFQGQLHWNLSLRNLNT